MRKAAWVFIGLALSCATAAHADVVPRASNPAGSVIARKTGEEVRFIDVSAWRGVDIHQDLLAGDVLRTNPLGSLAVLFSDNTQMRLGRNTTLLVKEIKAAGDSEVELQEGSIWARAERGGDGVVVETPAAAAAIRGTDWTMTVDGTGRTSLIVLEGVVELSNEFGSVSVARGEAASAAIGQAPTKTVVVDPDDREQMLFYLSLRNGFTLMPPSPLSAPQMRSERERISAVPEPARSAEDWLSLAEVLLPYEGRTAAVAAADRARALGLSRSQKARLDLLDGLMAAQDLRYGEADALFRRARPGLSGSRRVMADYGGYYARSLANPERVETPPKPAGGGPYGVLIEAFTRGFLDDIPRAIEVLRAGEAQFPDDPTLPAGRAQLALLVNDRVQMKEAYERALSLDPDHPIALEARAHYRSDYESDLDGALADLQHALRVAPGSDTAWNSLGVLHLQRDAEREAEAALKRVLELEPHDVPGHANLALLYLFQNRLPEAKVHIDAALEADPSFDIGLVARGGYHAKKGNLAQAEQDLLAGTTANPANADGLALLSMIYFEKGDRLAGMQALENADRLDPNYAASAALRTNVAVDEYDSDTAILSAQDALKRARARGGDYSSLNANRTEGSVLSQAYSLQGLDAWGRFYGDAVFDPFSASALFDQALSGSEDPILNSMGPGVSPAVPVTGDDYFSGILQGSLLAPESIVDRRIGISLVQRPFFEVEAGGSAIGGAASGTNYEILAQGLIMEPFPIAAVAAFSANDRSETRVDDTPSVSAFSNRFDLKEDNATGTLIVGAKPTPYDRLVAYYLRSDVDSATQNGLQIAPPGTVENVRIPGITQPIALPVDAGFYTEGSNNVVDSYGVAWNHTFGYRNMVSVGVFGSQLASTDGEARGLQVRVGDDVLTPFETETTTGDIGSLIGAVNHTVGVGDFTFRYGVEGGKSSVKTETVTTRGLIGLPPEIETRNTDVDIALGRAYVDAIYDINQDWRAEAALFARYTEANGIDDVTWEPRVGLAWTPIDGHLLRAGYMREGTTFNIVSLSPIGIVGLQPNQVPLSPGGIRETYAARWDAEWTPHIFTSVDYQHQEVEGFSITPPTATPTASLDIASGTIDRVSATANVWLTHGFGAFATYAYTRSEDTSDDRGDRLPFVPEHVARVGLTYVNTFDIKATVAATYVGERTAQDFATVLDDYWTLDAFLTWEPFDDRMMLQLGAYNLLDESFELAPDTPGWGRTFTGSLKIRF